MKLYPHQEKFLNDNPNKALLAFDTGCGKTLSSIEWMKKRPNLNHLIIVPKNIKVKWERDMLEHKEIKCEVITKEEFKKYSSSHADSLVIDEADFFGSPLFMKGRSQLATKLYEYISKNKIEHILLMTATPLRNAPHTMHSLLAYIGLAPLWKEWQRSCYELSYLPYLPTAAYLPKKLWRKTVIDYAKPKIYTAKISDIADVPTQHEEYIRLKTDEPKEILADNPVSEWHEYARAESYGIKAHPKIEWIKDYIRGKSKVIIVCRYKAQIAEYAKELSKEREVFTLTGETRNQDEVIQNAKESFECVFLIQASIGAGFELPEFSYMIFASMSFSHRDYIQMKGRILRINHLKQNWYTYLIGGNKDNSVYKKIMAGEDYTIA